MIIYIFGHIFNFGRWYVLAIIDWYWNLIRKLNWLVLLLTHEYGTFMALNFNLFGALKNKRRVEIFTCQHTNYNFEDFVSALQELIIKFEIVDPLTFIILLLENHVPAILSA